MRSPARWLISQVVDFPEARPEKIIIGLGVYAELLKMSGPRTLGDLEQPFVSASIMGIPITLKPGHKGATLVMPSGLRFEYSDMG